jgi:serine/threonine protein kinase
MDGAVLTPDVVRAFPPETFQSDTIPPEDVDEEHEPTDEFTTAADIYALGAVVYESLVGFHPFFDDEEEPTDASEGIARIQSEAPRPLKDFGVEDELSEVVERALARQPAQRWESVRAFADALERAHGDQSTTQPTSPEGEQAPTPETAPDPEGDRASDPAIVDREATEFDPSSEHIEPGGPSSILTTLAIALLVASNIGWFFYAMGEDEASSSSPPPAPAVTDDTLALDSEPSGATVYVEGREKPLGKTPVELPVTLFDGTPIRLDVRKTGFEDTGISLRAQSGSRQLVVPLHNKTAD